MLLSGCSIILCFSVVVQVCSLICVLVGKGVCLLLLWVSLKVIIMLVWCMLVMWGWLVNGVVSCCIILVVLWLCVIILLVVKMFSVVSVVVQVSGLFVQLCECRKVCLCELFRKVLYSVWVVNIVVSGRNLLVRFLDRYSRFGIILVCLQVNSVLVWLKLVVILLVIRNVLLVLYSVCVCCRYIGLCMCMLLVYCSCGFRIIVQILLGCWLNRLVRWLVVLWVCWVVF